MNKPWMVLDLGAAVVSSAEGWRVAARRIDSARKEHRVVVTVSALRGVTEELEEVIDACVESNADRRLEAIRRRYEHLLEAFGLAFETGDRASRLLDECASLLEGVRLSGEAPPRLRARILAVGERVCVCIGLEIVKALGLEMEALDVARVLVTSARPGSTEEEHYLDARVDSRSIGRLIAADIERGELFLGEGSIARSPEGDLCLLGREGGGTAAAPIAAALGAASFEAWTDVPGLFTANPQSIPSARLIRSIGYRQAREMAAMGARVLHPRCFEILAERDVPISIHSFTRPEVRGTRIESQVTDHRGVSAVTCRTDVTLLTLSTLAMWNESGFLARAFAPFAEMGISIDLVATSQSAITLTLDQIPGGIEGRAMRRLLRRLEELGSVQVRHSLAVVSIVGRGVRSVLHEMGGAMEVFRERPVYLISNSSEDLNLSFVVEEEDASALVARLHGQLISSQGERNRLGDTWEMLTGRFASAGSEGGHGPPWWVDRREELLQLVTDEKACYVYSLGRVEAAVTALLEGVASVSRCYYSIKANHHESIVRTIARRGMGLECVSIDEVRHARRIAPDAPLLFTPNFCPVEEYREAFDAGAEVVIDGAHLLFEFESVFRGREIGLRLDPGQGRGHHAKVRTAGEQTKFGCPPADLERAAERAREIGARIVGLHAHVGSGVLDSALWPEIARFLICRAKLFPELRWLDLGGGLGVVERPGQRSLDLHAFDKALAAVRSDFPSIEFRLEPGRFLVSEAGVLLLPVTQVRSKLGIRYVGVSTGMNTLIRPALYGAWHSIHNLSRWSEAACGYAHIVGPICETGDVLGRDRALPETKVGDVLLLENAGAYGAVMSSAYNLRSPAQERIVS